MAEVILMPRLSDTMTEGVIAAWHKNVGDVVKKGDILAEIETDKATMDLESYKDGILLYVGAPKGKALAVNDLLAIIGEANENVDVLVQTHQTPTAETKEVKSTTNAPADGHSTTSTVYSTNGITDGDRIKASPLARKIASEKGISLNTIQGSGDSGRIVKKDVDSFAPLSEKTMETKKVSGVSAVFAESFEDVPISSMRKTIARRLSESKFTAPHFYLTVTINMDKAVESRSKLNNISSVKISFNDMVIKAVATALQKHPAVNTSWLGDVIRYNHHIHIGVAIAVEDGLLVPVVRFANTKSLSQIATEVKAFAQKAKDKKLQPADWEGNTFTISNLGMFGIDDFTAIINPPDACILAIGAIHEKPIVKNGEIKIGHEMKVTLSCDHRVVDGATGAAFLQTLKALLEEPLCMLV